MYKISITVGFLILLANSCHSSNEDSGLIDYKELSDIEITLVKEIGGSDKFLFGELRDLILLSDGIILVSDWGKITIEQFNSDGGHVGTIAKEGRGPGELSTFFLLHEGRNDTLIVRHHGVSQQIDYFGRGTDYSIYAHARSTVMEQFTERIVVFIGAISDSEYLARASWNIRYLQERLQNQANYGLTPIVTVDEFENILRDSLHILKGPRPLVEYGEHGVRSRYVIGTPPYQYHDRLRLMGNDRYMIARPDSAVLFIYNRDHELDKNITLNVKERLVGDVNPDYNLRDVPGNYRREMEARIPDIIPPFLNIWVSEDYFWLHTDTSEDGKQIVVLNMEGEAIGKFYLSVWDDIRYFRGHRIYTIHKDLEHGHSIRIYQVNL